MSKLIAAINMSLDGFCDHTALIADDEIHQHYSELLQTADTILYGRITYQLMEYWRTFVENPGGDKSMDEFALVMDKIQKVVFSNTLTHIDWKTARLATKEIKEEVFELRQGAEKDILVGSRSLIITLLNLNLIDEFQLCIQPIIVGRSLPLFQNIIDRKHFKLIKTKALHNSGSMVFYYAPTKA